MRNLIERWFDSTKSFFRPKVWKEISRTYQGVRYDGDPCCGIVDCFHVWEVTEEDEESGKRRIRRIDSWDGP